MNKRIFFSIIGAILMLTLCGFAQQMSGAEKYTVTATTLNVRSGAGGSYSKIGSFAQNETVEVMEITNSWAKIQYKGRTGYVNFDYLQKQAVSQNITSSEYNSTTNNSDSWQGLITIIFVLSALLFVMSIAGWDEGIFARICDIALPVLCLIYFLLAPNEMFFVSPKEVGWFWTVVNGFIFILMLIRICATVKSVCKDLKEDLSDILLWIFFVLYLGAGIAIGFDAAWWVIIGAVFGFFGQERGTTQRDLEEFKRLHPDLDWDSGSSGGSDYDSDDYGRRSYDDRDYDDKNHSSSSSSSSSALRSGTSSYNCGNCGWGDREDERYVRCKERGGEYIYSTNSIPKVCDSWI